ncbi:hypothetical protein H6P81_017204 [Aristolochia fimbriata]|uniref:Pectinesterase n=1 Tax=Aristolochia fimbriata TaxID=158543 RepID=A0AAV7DXH0_ARIFI|nr:hypothetical protein H6P81_017204 [Aristolochia fimbriata]
MGASVFSHLLFVLFAVCGIQVGFCWGRGSGRDFIDWDDLSMVDDLGKLDSVKERRGLILVSKDGNGDARTVQDAVNMVPDWNVERVKIIIRPGIYREKVVVPVTKSYISFIGEDSSRTVISWNSRASDRNGNGQPVGTFNTATVAIEADFFCAHGITFENTAPTPLPGAEGQQAVAVRISGDKSMFYRCKILSSQDTLFDHNGRHYFYQTYIQGSVDFIFGHGRSLYQDCTLHAIASSYGAIAASQRDKPTEDSGFSFIHCNLKGSGSVYLGRAWGRYATVIYSYCNFEDIINPEGWHDWGDPSRRRTVLFGEFNCTGGGADSRWRVPWAKSFSYEEAKPFMGRRFIDGDVWLKL